MVKRHALSVALSAVASGFAGAFFGGGMAVELSAQDASASGAPRRIKLLPFGEFASIDGRPGNMEGSNTPVWRLTAEAGHRLVGAFGEKKQKMLIDYEHQTLRAEKNGLPNPAAAWVVGLTYVSEGAEGGAGLYAQVEWTAAAAAMVSRGEYRYLSPVFNFDPDTGEVLSLAARHTPQFSTPPETGNPQEPPMKLLLAALGLSAVASEEAGLTALTALQSQVASKDALIVELRGKQFDPSQHIPLAEHKKVADQLAALSAQTETTEHTVLMTAALADARILPVNADYWKAQPLAALKAFLKDAKPLSAALSGLQTNGHPPAGGGLTAVLSAEDKAVCEQLGLKPEDYLKNKAVATA
jgi:phage I-like protein